MSSFPRRLISFRPASVLLARVAVPVLLAALLVGATAPATARAQVLSLEVQGGASIGAYDETRAGLDAAPRPTLRAEVGYTPIIRRRLTAGVYASYERSSFGCEDGFCGGYDVEMTSAGLGAGLRFGLRLPGRPWLRLGAAYHGLDLSASGGGEGAPEETFEPDPGATLGLEVGTGVAVPVTPWLALTPGVSYVRYASATAAGTPGEESAVVVVSGRLGLRFTLPVGEGAGAQAP